jgi:hypothetical protein
LTARNINSTINVGSDGLLVVMTEMAETLVDRPGEKWAELGVKDSTRLSSHGRVARVTKTGEMVECHSVAVCDYLSVKFDGVQHKIHRLVKIVFGSDEDRRKLSSGEYDVDHKDEDKRNNHIDNLQLLTRSEHARKTREAQRKKARLDEGSNQA